MAHPDSLNQTELVVDQIDRARDNVIIWAHTDAPTLEEAEGSGWLRPTDGSEAMEVPRFRRVGATEFQLATFDADIAPVVGGHYWLQYAWIDGVLEALREGKWRRQEIRDPEFHEWCWVTYQNIEPGESAYVSEEGVWLSVGAWEDYVRDDKIRLRSFRWPDRVTFSDAD